MEIFRSKIDTWFSATVAVSTIIVLVTAYITAKQGGLANYLIALVITAIGASFPLWLLFSTKYLVSNEELKIRSGPFTWSIMISSIVSVKETNNPLSSPALSLDRLELIYASGKSIMVSPADKKGFLAAIRHS